ncbi:MAG: sensor histidine kinase [Bacteroidota bacterium]
MKQYFQKSGLAKDVVWKGMMILALFALAIQLLLDATDWLRGDQSAFSWQRTLKSFLINYPNLLLITYLDVMVIRWLNQQFPWERRNILLRTSLEFLACASLVTFLVVGGNLLIAWLDPAESFTTNEIMYSVIVGITLNLIVILTLEFIFQYTNRYQATLNYEMLKKDNIHFQYEMLKNQLNPHFLFNSLNALSSLIAVSPAEARTFVRKLARVYRYVLEHREKDTISLKEELDFLEHYIFLLKTRFGESLQVNVAIPEEQWEKKVVPMALQMLIENSVKHNAISVHQPLRVQVFTRDNYLWVVNDLHPKAYTYPSGVGLKNIRERYRLFYDNELSIESTDESFQVKLPLIDAV